MELGLREGLGVGLERLLPGLLVEVLESTAHGVVRVGLLLALGRRRRAVLGPLLRGHVLRALLPHRVGLSRRKGWGWG